MAKKEPIKVVEKDVQWFKNVIGATDKEIKGFQTEGFPVIYVYEMYPYGGGDDQVRLTSFKQVLPDAFIQKRFSNSKIRGQLFGAVCMVDLRKVSNS